MLQRGRNAFDEIKETVATRLNMGAMLNIIWRPVTLSRRVVAVVEQRFESLQDEGLVGLLNRVLHFVLLPQWLHFHFSSSPAVYWGSRSDLRPFLAAYRDGDATIGVVASDCTVWQTAGTDSRRSAGDSDNYRNEVELKRRTRGRRERLFEKIATSNLSDL